jgi:hypothetical protein
VGSVAIIISRRSTVITTHGGSRGYGWVAPAAVLAITGLAVGLAASTYYAPPVQVVAPQPVYVPPPTAYWNYCGSAGNIIPTFATVPKAGNWFRRASRANSGRGGLRIVRCIVVVDILETSGVCSRLTAGLGLAFSILE